MILNRGSGRQRGEDRATLIKRAFAALQINVQIFSFRKGRSLKSAVEDALKSGATTIVAAGGDGTICGVAQHIADRNVVLGILPLGTFNYFARSLDLPEDIDGAAAVIAQGNAAGVRLARINDRVFLNNASIGAYAAILETREGVYKRWGRSRFAAYWSVLKTLATFRAPLAIDVDVDGETHRFRTSIAFAINNAFQLDQMGIEGRDCIEQGKLVLLIAPDTTRLGLMKHAVSLALRTARPQMDYKMYCGREITIRTRKNERLVARDGEKERQKGPFRLSLDTTPQQVLMPATAASTVR